MRQRAKVFSWEQSANDWMEENAHHINVVNVVLQSSSATTSLGSDPTGSSEVSKMIAVIYTDDKDEQVPHSAG